MRIDEKAIYNIYSNSPNADNTSRGNSSLKFVPMDYSQARQEQEESDTAKKQVLKDLQYSIDRCRVGSKEEYSKALLTLNKTIKNIQDILSR